MGWWRRIPPDMLRAAVLPRGMPHPADVRGRLRHFVLQGSCPVTAALDTRHLRKHTAADSGEHGGLAPAHGHDCRRDICLLRR